MDIVIFRHGQTDWNIEGRLQGSTDISLNAAGLQEAEALSLRLKHIDFDLIASSDLSRALLTALAVEKGRNLGVLKDQRLRELTLGDAEGKTMDELQLKYGHIPAHGFAFPGREPKESVILRVNEFVSELESKGYTSIAISSHGGVVWNWLHQFDNTDEIGRIGNAEAFQVKWEKGVGRYLNRISNK